MQIHFWTGDIDRAIDFYTRVLGFSLTYSQPEEGALDFCILKLGEEQVMFGIPPEALIAQARSDQPLMQEVLTRIGQGGALSIYVPVPDIDAHYQNAREKDAEILEPLWSPPWGQTQYSLQDPDGNLLTFYSPR